MSEPPVPSNSAAFVANLPPRSASQYAFQQRSPLSGAKPKEGDDDVHILPNVSSRYILRAWGLKHMDRTWHGHYFLDYIDRQTGHPVNSPPGYSIFPLQEWKDAMVDSQAGGEFEATPLRPFVGMEYWSSRTQGDEYYLVAERTVYVLVGPDSEVAKGRILFETPSRQRQYEIARFIHQPHRSR